MVERRVPCVLLCLIWIVCQWCSGNTTNNTLRVITTTFKIAESWSETFDTRLVSLCPSREPSIIFGFVWDKSGWRLKALFEFLDASNLSPCQIWRIPLTPFGMPLDEVCCVARQFGNTNPYSQSLTSVRGVTLDTLTYVEYNQPLLRICTNRCVDIMGTSLLGVSVISAQMSSVCVY